MIKTAIVALILTAAGVSLLHLHAGDFLLDLSSVKDVTLTAHVNGKPASPPAGTQAKVSKEGLQLDYVFPSEGHDACMAEFPVKLEKFTAFAVTFTAKQAGHRPFLVLTDRNGEKHYFAFSTETEFNGRRLIANQAIRASGKQVMNGRITLANKHPGERFAFRWGGDDNQIIDFPVQKLMIGLNDFPDASQGKGSIVFHSITFKE